MPFQYTCETCGNSFERVSRPDGQRNAHRFCSRACRYSKSPADRLWSRVNTGGADECWLWTGSKRGNGYGNIKYEGESVATHRLAFYLTHGRWPDHHVLHTCDTPACCNPAHLFEGTHQDNMDDMFAKGRRTAARQAGESNPASRLTLAQVIEIRDKYGAGGTSLSRLGREYGVAHQTISKIVNGKRWAEEVRGAGTTTLILRAAQ